MKCWADLTAENQRYVHVSGGLVRERRGPVVSLLRPPRTLVLYRGPTSCALGVGLYRRAPAFSVTPAPDEQAITRIDVSLPNITGTTSWGWRLHHLLPWWSLDTGTAHTTPAEPRPSTVTITRPAAQTWRINIDRPTGRDRIDPRRPTGWWQLTATDSTWDQLTVSWSLRSGPRTATGRMTVRRSTPAQPPQQRLPTFLARPLGLRQPYPTPALAYIRRPPPGGFGGLTGRPTPTQPTA